MQTNRILRRSRRKVSPTQPGERKPVRVSCVIERDTLPLIVEW